MLMVMTICLDTYFETVTARISQTWPAQGLCHEDDASCAAHQVMTMLYAVMLNGLALYRSVVML